LIRRLEDLEAIVPKIYGPAAHLNLTKAITHCSAYHSILIDGNLKIFIALVYGKAYTFGRNDKHQLGDSSTKSRSDLFAIILDEKVIDGACARGHSLLLTESGKVYGVGNNSNFEATGGSSKDQDITKFTLVKGLEGVKVVQVAAGIDFSMALSDDGKVYAWGSPQYGQLGTTGSDHEYIGSKKKVLSVLVI
jgi:alpha-tubulin suppressor-like RCC1 family protein